MADILQSIADLISPRSAEAKIVGDPASMSLIRDRYEAGKQLPQQNEYLSTMYNDIVAAAQNRPETVSVNSAPGLSHVYGAAGDYENSKVFYDPKYSTEDKYHTIAHELFHFLNEVTGENLSTKQQHELLKSILGTDIYKPTSELVQYKEPVLTDEQKNILQRIIGK